MTVKKMISIPDDLDAMINEYNEKHKFKKLHISEICQQAIYEEISRISKAVPTKEKIIESKPVALIETLAPVEHSLEDQDKPIIPCQICGKEFVQTKPSRIYCSKYCGTKASRMRNKDIK